MGDTKPPGEWWQTTLEFPEVRGSQIWGDKPLVSRQAAYRTFSGRCSWDPPVGKNGRFSESEMQCEVGNKPLEV
jgi:hypothetical protein